MDYIEIKQLIKRQIEYHEQAAEKAGSVGSSESHDNRASRWREALSSLEQLLAQASSPALDDGTMLRPEDLEGLPDELLVELNRDELETRIQRIIKDAGGVMSLDRLMIALYRENGEIHKRRQLTQKLYRMAGKGALYSVPHRKAVYSTYPQSDADRENSGGEESYNHDEEDDV